MNPYNDFAYRMLVARLRTPESRWQQWLRYFGF